MNPPFPMTPKHINLRSRMNASLRSYLHVRRSCLPAWIALAAFAFYFSIPPEARAAAAPPDRMSYQGFLVDGGGSPLAPTTPVNYPVVFRIYDEMDGGNLIWSEQQVVTVDKGNFSVILGEGAAVTSEPNGPLSAVFAGNTSTARFMGTTVTVGASTFTLLPRLRLLPSPYAFTASQATQLINPSTGATYLSLGAGIVEVSGVVNASGGLTGLTAAQVPNLNASKITAGTFADGLLPTTQSGKTFTGQVRINGGNVIEFGAGVSPKEINNGKIGYGTFTANTLDIVGAGVDVPNRRIRFHAQGLSEFIGPVNIQNSGSSISLDVSSSAIWRPLAIRGNGGTDMIVAGNLGGRATIGGHNGAGNAWADMSLNPGGGRVGIGTTGPAYLLHLATSDLDQARMRINHGGNYADFGRWSNYLYVQLNNSVHAAANRFASYDGDSNWDFNSDRKLKKDIVDAEPMLDRALKVQVRRYRWKEDDESSTHKLGVIAQEVRPLFPEMVNEVEMPNGEGEKVLTVGYGDFGVIAIKAIQELNQVVESKEARIKALEAELAALKKQVASNQDASSQWEARFAALEKLLAASTRPEGTAVAAR